MRSMHIVNKSKRDGRQQDEYPYPLCESYIFCTPSISCILSQLNQIFFRSVVCIKCAFYQCNSLDKFYVPSTVTSLGAYAFYGCKSLINVQFANNSQLSIIGESAFRECPALTSIIIPDKVTKLDSTMFFKCTSLTYVVLPSGITDIGPEVFHTCSNLDTVYFKGTAEEWNNISVGYSNESLLSAEICFYSQSRPTSSGNFWHYVNGIATKW